MADTTSPTITPAQQQYPDLNPYQEKASSLLSSKVSKHHHISRTCIQQAASNMAATIAAIEQASKQGKEQPPTRHCLVAFAETATWASCYH